MKREEIFKKLDLVFQDVFDDSGIRVGEATEAVDIDGWDSLMHITLISAVESEFGVKFRMKEVVGLKNVGDMADIIEREAR